MQLKKLSIRPIKILWALLAVAYPIAVFVALRHDFSARILGFVLVCVILIALTQHKNIWLGICGIILGSLSLISDKEVFLKLYPVFMNAAVCVTFLISLRTVPLIQRIAEKIKYKMDDYAKLYARRVTIAWAIFMGINTIISLGTVFMSDWVWTLYNGLVSYCLIGAMFIMEYVIRKGVINANK